MTADPRRLRIVLLVPNLNRGGTERQVVLLAATLRELGHDVSVAVFRGGGAFAETLARANVGLVDLQGNGAAAPVRVIANLAQLLRNERVDVLYSFLPPASVAASAAGLFAPACRVFWSIRAADMPLAGYPLRTRLAYALERMLSRLPRRIIVNSRAGLESCERRGFPSGKLRAVSNGFDTSVFRPNGDERQRLRAEFNIRDDEIAIGIPARMDPVKDHVTFFHAAARLCARRNDLKFVCLGGGGAPDHMALLHDLARSLNIADRVIWAGERADMPAALNALDLATLCSKSEGFPNAVGEAMATGVPVVVTDVGDAAYLLGDAGLVVPPSDPTALANAWEQMLDPAPRARLAEAARARIVEHFSLQRLAEKTLAVFAEPA